MGLGDEGTPPPLPKAPCGLRFGGRPNCEAGVEADADVDVVDGVEGDAGEDEEDEEGEDDDDDEDDEEEEEL